jgi:hypothetical protein
MTKSDKHINIIGVSVNIANKLLNIYWNILKDKHNKENKSNLSFSSLLDKWESDYKEFNNILDDSFRSNLGNKIIEILDACDMVKKKLIKKKC